jgi:hypothetical protein
VVEEAQQGIGIIIMMTINRFELFSDHPDFQQADDAMTAALLVAAALPNWDSARAYMEKVQGVYDYVGAHDTEPRNLIVTALNEIFPDDRRDWWGRKPRP